MARQAAMKASELQLRGTGHLRSYQKGRKELPTGPDPGMRPKERKGKDQ